MLILRVDSDAPDDEIVRRAADLVRSGGIVAFPTDTLYGVAVDPRNDAAIARLFEAKARDRGLAVPLIAGSLDQALDVAAFTPADVRLARAFWPGPLSIVVRASRAISAELLGPGATLAIRVPAHAVARALPLALGCAVTATSANISGAPPAQSAADVIAALGDRIDAIVDAGPAPGGPPSTIVQLRDDGPRLIRAGAVAWERVLEFVE
jgi:L-threonylcarbamoyladenylate synthase